MRLAWIFWKDMHKYLQKTVRPGYFQNRRDIGIEGTMFRFDVFKG